MQLLPKQTPPETQISPSQLHESGLATHGHSTGTRDKPRAVNGNNHRRDQGKAAGGPGVSLGCDQSPRLCPPVEQVYALHRPENRRT